MEKIFHVYYLASNELIGVEFPLQSDNKVDVLNLHPSSEKNDTLDVKRADTLATIFNYLFRGWALLTCLTPNFNANNIHTYIYCTLSNLPLGATTFPSSVPITFSFKFFKLLPKKSRSNQVQNTVSICL